MWIPRLLIAAYIAAAIEAAWRGDSKKMFYWIGAIIIVSSVESM